MLRLSCPHCAVALALPETAAGRVTHCTRCRGALTVPGAVPVAVVESESAPRPPPLTYPLRRGASAVAWVAWLLVLGGCALALVGVGVALGPGLADGRESLMQLMQQTRDLQLIGLGVLVLCAVALAVDRMTR